MWYTSSVFVITLTNNNNFYTIKKYIMKHLICVKLYNYSNIIIYSIIFFYYNTVAFRAELNDNEQKTILVGHRLWYTHLKMIKKKCIFFFI